MSAAEVKAAQKRLGLNNEETAKALGVTLRTLERWRSDGAPALARVAFRGLEQTNKSKRGG